MSLLVIDNCDAAIIGYTAGTEGVLAVYDYNKLVDVFREQFRDEPATQEEIAEMAVEWVEFNIVGAYMGPGTPLIMYPADRAMIDELADQEDDDG